MLQLFMQFDPAKDASNHAKHGISLSRAADLELEATMVDDRADYGEPRWVGFGMIDGLPYCLVFTVRDGEVRPISLRRAGMREYRRYVQAG